MPRVKSIKLTPTQIEDEGWKRVNIAIKKAMYDNGITTTRELSRVVGIGEKTLSSRFNRRIGWKAGEIFRIVYVLGIDDEEVEKILNLLRGGKR